MPGKCIIAEHIRPLAPVSTGLEPSKNGIDGICCILFDIYGTLFISTSGDIGISAKPDRNIRRLAGLLDKYDQGIAPNQLQANLWAAVRADHIKSKKKGIDFPEVRIEEIWKQVLDINDLERIKNFAIEYEWLVNPVYPMPGLLNMLGQLKRMGVHLGIISNAQFYTPLLFKWLLGSDMADLGFERDLIFFSYEHGCAKPSPALFKQAAKSLGSKKIALDATLYVGNDMLNDIHPAALSGMNTALFAGDARSLRLREDRHECKGLSADRVITDLRQIPILINQGSANDKKENK
jgi:putative hydrolase of the HAD superfamily